MFQPMDLCYGSLSELYNTDVHYTESALLITLGLGLVLGVLIYIYMYIYIDVSMFLNFFKKCRPIL